MQFAVHPQVGLEIRLWGVYQVLCDFVSDKVQMYKNKDRWGGPDLNEEHKRQVKFIDCPKSNSKLLLWPRLKQSEKFSGPAHLRAGEYI